MTRLARGFGLTLLACVLSIGTVGLDAAPGEPTAAAERRSSAADETGGRRAAPETHVRADFRRPRYVRFPEHAPFDARAAQLGKMLFFDPRLSRSGSISCASCHNPSFGWELPSQRAPVGTQLTRQPQTLLNVAWSKRLFWDGRAPSLEIQALSPISNPTEMATSIQAVLKKLSAIRSYEKRFRIAFPGEGLTQETVLTALATFERTIVSGWAPFDAWVSGDEKALSESAKRGFRLFAGEAGCARCHSGWNFTDNSFHDTGLPSPDLGRAAIVGGEDGRKPFKTPTLRDIAKRAPYMHDGSLPDLDAVLDHYMATEASEDLQSIALDVDQRSDMIAFLQSLSSDAADIVAPTLPVD